MSVEESRSKEQQNTLGTGQFGPTPPKKQKQSKCKDSGIKGTFVLGIVQEIPETYQNFKMMLREIGIDKLAFFKSCVDLKAKRIILGQSSLTTLMK